VKQIPKTHLIVEAISGQGVLHSFPDGCFWGGGAEVLANTGGVRCFIQHPKALVAGEFSGWQEPCTRK